MEELYTNLSMSRTEEQAALLSSLYLIMSNRYNAIDALP